MDTIAELAEDIVPIALPPNVHQVFDPCRPIHETDPRRQARRSASVSKQRQRRSCILATIRMLLMTGGVDAVTMRRIATESGHAVQTIYNLVGPREHAIAEAISEYTRYVGRSSANDPADPDIVVSLIDQWVKSIAACPDFCKQVSLIALTPSRRIFYAIREKQMKGLFGLLLRQQRNGILRRDANVRDLAHQMAFAASALCIEWADRPFPVNELQRQLTATFTNLTASAIIPGARHLHFV